MKNDVFERSLKLVDAHLNEVLDEEFIQLYNICNHQSTPQQKQPHPKWFNRKISVYSVLYHNEAWAKKEINSNMVTIKPFMYRIKVKGCTTLTLNCVVDEKTYMFNNWLDWFLPSKAVRTLQFFVSPDGSHVLDLSITIPKGLIEPQRTIIEVLLGGYGYIIQPNKKDNWFEIIADEVVTYKLTDPHVVYQT